MADLGMGNMGASPGAPTHLYTQRGPTKYNLFPKSHVFISHLANDIKRSIENHFLLKVKIVQKKRSRHRCFTAQNKS